MNLLLSLVPIQKFRASKVISYLFYQLFLWCYRDVPFPSMLLEMFYHSSQQADFASLSNRDKEQVAVILYQKIRRTFLYYLYLYEYHHTLWLMKSLSSQFSLLLSLCEKRRKEVCST